MQGTINYQPRVPWLEGKASNIFTQFGEDGLVDEVFQRIGETNHHCFEIGAADGLLYSNTLRWRQDGWYAVLIEADPVLFKKLQTGYGHESDCFHEKCDDLDEAFRGTFLDRQPDLGIIDIDGQDWHLWRKLKEYRPRVMLVEISTVGPGAPIPDPGGPGQAGLDAIHSLGTEKGYELVATTHCNALFVDGGLL